MRSRVTRVVVAALLGVLAAGAAACASSDEPRESAPTPVPALSQSSQTQDPARGSVVSIVDGVTIEVENAGSVYLVRYIGLTLPFDGDASGAADFNRFLVEGKAVDLAKDEVNTDADGALLRYVYSDGEMVNTKLLTGGWATVANHPASFEHVETFMRAEADAKANRRGVWSEEASHGPETPMPTPSAAGEFGGGGTLPNPFGPGLGGLCDFSGTSEPIIKGNIDPRTSGRTYHVPGGLFYSTTVIDETQGEAWFCTELDAQAYGWRRSKR